MIGYIINSNDLAQTLKRNLTLFQTIKVAYDAAIINAGKEAVRLIKQRVQQRGESAEGTKLVTGSRTPIGAYGQRQGLARQARGLQTRYQDLTFTGEMMRDFNLVSLRNKLLEVGFQDSLQADKMEEVEALHGVDIMTVSDEEEEAAVLKLEEGVIGILDKLFS